MVLLLAGWLFGGADPGRALAQAPPPKVEIILESIGVGGHLKPGAINPVRLSLRSRLEETGSVLVAFEVVNRDGDVEQYMVPVVLSPGRTNRTWLYPSLPPAASAVELRSSVFRVVVFEDDGGRPGAELASAPVSAASAVLPGIPVEMTEDLLLVVGSGTMGLDAYQRGQGRTPLIPSLNTRCVVGTVQPEGLPDRARGLDSVETLLWSDASPTALGLEQATALKGWLSGGGRLVIVLPEGSDPWSIGSSTRTAISDLLPERAPRRLENVPVESLLQALSKSPGLRNPEARSSIRLFDPGALDESWEPLAAIPGPTGEAAEPPDDPGVEGGLYAIQRRVGFGWLVLVGIDADAISRRQLQPGLLPQADVFWNRLLARRGSIPPLAAFNAYRDRELLRQGEEVFNLGAGDLVLDGIRIGGVSAGTWLLVVLALFLLYGFLAGPISYWWLKRRGLVRFSWLVFLGFALAFTGLSLAAASIGRAIMSREAPVRHLTFLDVIDGEPVARATTWFSAYLPDYGRSELSVDDPDAVIRTWSPPPSGSVERFPNSVSYPVSEPTNRLEVPARGTSALLTASWRGPLEGPWLEVPTVGEQPIRQLVYPTEPPSFAVQGLIRHGLPWDFDRIRIIQVGPIDTTLPRYTQVDELSRELPISPLPNPGAFIGLNPRDWPRGEAIDLTGLFPSPSTVAGSRLSDPERSLGRQMEEVYQKRVLSQLEATLLGTRGVWSDLRQESLEMYALFRMLPQPVYLLEQPGWKNSAPALRLQRWMGARTDCSDWLVRPCIILLGTLEGVPCPVPLQVDGARVESTGTVVLRWIHPLPVDERYVVTPPRRLEPLLLGPPESPEGASN